MDLLGTENKAQGIGRLFEELQELVGGDGIHGLGRRDQDQAHGRFQGRVVGPFVHLLHLILQDLAGARAGFQNQDIGMRAALDLALGSGGMIGVETLRDQVLINQ